MKASSLTELTEGNTGTGKTSLLLSKVLGISEHSKILGVNTVVL